MKDFLDFVPIVLNFGFLGLSVIMLYLGFKAMQTINSTENPEPAKVSLTRFYLMISLAFMIVAGPLQFALLYAQQTFSPTVMLYVSAQNKGWTEVGKENIYLFHRNKDHPLINNPVTLKFGNKDTISIDVSEVRRVIEKLRSQVQVAAPPPDESYNKALTGG